jgi:hypothetical protein
VKRWSVTTTAVACVGAVSKITERRYWDEDGDHRYDLVPGGGIGYHSIQHMWGKESKDRYIIDKSLFVPKNNRS